jgi:hypothetical protein
MGPWEPLPNCSMLPFIQTTQAHQALVGIMVGAGQSLPWDSSRLRVDIDL